MPSIYESNSLNRGFYSPPATDSPASETYEAMYSGLAGQARMYTPNVER